jgi:hypothetical protein
MMPFIILSLQIMLLGVIVLAELSTIRSEIKEIKKLQGNAHDPK